MVPDPYDMSALAEADTVLRPLIELESEAARCWLLQAIAVFPEFRGRGLGGMLLDRACEAARTAGATRIALQVESANEGALAFYRRAGFRECARLPVVPFPGSDDDGDLILMVREL